jgi:hypothetical protein
MHPDSQRRWSTHLSALLPPILVFLIAAIAYLQFGFEGTLVSDDAVIMYSAQQLVRGVPVHSSIVILKGPMASFIAGAGAFAASILGANDLLTVRVLFFIISCLTAVAVYYLGASLFRSPRLGILAGLIFTGFVGFGKHACSGPRPKTPMLLFVVLCLWLITQRRWWWAGFFGSLAMLTWQPTGVYVAAALLFALLWSEQGMPRWRNLLICLAGVLTPILAVVIYHLLTGSFYHFLEGYILFNLRYRGVAEWRASYTLFKHFWLPIRAVFNGYPTSAPFIFFGLLIMLGLYAWRARVQKSLLKALFSDPFSPVLLTLPAPIIWSLMDFQGYPDFYIFLPYAAVGAAWMMHLTLEKFEEVVAPGKRAQVVSFGTACALLVALAVGSHGTVSETGLRDQLSWAQEIEETYLPDPDTLYPAIGRVEDLVLMQRTSPSRFIWVGDAVTNLMDDTLEGGFEGWVAEILAQEPKVIAQGSNLPVSRRQLLRKMLKPDYEMKTIGDWIIFVRREQTL